MLLFETIVLFLNPFKPAQLWDVHYSSERKKGRKDGKEEKREREEGEKGERGEREGEMNR